MYPIEWTITSRSVDIDRETKKIADTSGNNPQIARKFDERHKKTDLKIFVIVIPKGGWARVAAPILLLV